MFALGFLCSWLFMGDTNTGPMYGPTGAPKNCRALIASNLRKSCSMDTHLGSTSTTARFASPGLLPGMTVTPFARRFD